jgi:hypothetical protein
MTKTDKPRRIVIVKEGCSADPIALYQRYISLRPANIKHNRLFLRYANGKCTVQPVGINKIASIPSVIVSYLKLEHPETYTGHSLRRSSTTLLAEGGADVIKSHSRDGMEIPMFFVGGEAFPLRVNLMKPFSKPRIGTLNEEERIFNYRLSRARRIIVLYYNKIIQAMITTQMKQV